MDLRCCTVSVLDGTAVSPPAVICVEGLPNLLYVRQVPFERENCTFRALFRPGFHPSRKGSRMSPRRLSLLIVLIPVLAVSGVESRPLRAPEPAQPDGKAQPAKPPEVGWVKDRLAAVDKKLEEEIKDLVSLYKHIHENPELSLMEVNTAKKLAAEMKKAGCEVTENFGGNGIVAVLKNGEGPVVLIRTDMDALPIIEQTGLPYASKVKTKNRDGIEVGVM